MEIDGQLHLRGTLSSANAIKLSYPNNAPVALKQAFGDYSGLRGVVTKEGDVLQLLFEINTLQPKLIKAPKLDRVGLVAIAGNDHVSIVYGIQ